jgi:hypothetical protein
MNDARSLSKKSTTAATSSALPKRFIGKRLSKALRAAANSSGVRLARSSGVSMGPGPTALTRIREGANSSASDLVRE